MLAALAVAQVVFVDSKELEIRLSQLEFEWNSYLAEASRRSEETIAACEAQANCKFSFDSKALNLEVDAPAVEVAAEIDYWTRGGLTELLTRTRHELGKVFKPEVNALTVDDLRKLAERSQELRTDLDRLTGQARQALIASQLRHNIARRIETALGDEGWEVIDSAFEGEDQRDALHVKLGHQNGAEVVAEICPQAASDSAISNLVSVSFFDDGVTNHRLIDTRLRHVLESVATEGVEIGSPTCAPGFERSLRGPESARDFERVRQRKRVEARTRS